MDKVKVVPVKDTTDNIPLIINPLFIKAKKSKKKSKKKRCLKCKKKLGVMPFNCKCGNLFCSGCRHPESHECTFDFKTEAKEQLERQNPIIKFNKINPI